MRTLIVPAGALIGLSLVVSPFCFETARAQIAIAPAAASGANNSSQLGEELLRLSDRIAALERLVSQLVARQDEGQRAAVQLASEFARFKADSEARIEAIELEAAAAVANATAAPTAVAPTQEPEAPPTVVVAPVSVDRFDQGLAFAARQDWSQAEMAFDTFIANNPDDERVPAARYQLGLAYLGQQQPAQAARIFLDLFETGAAASFGADNLFALALALEQLDPGNTEQVCTVFSEIETSYGATLTPMQRERLLDLRLAADCPG